MLEIFETRKLVQSVDAIKTAPSFIVDTFYANKNVNTAEHIDVAIYDGKRKLAPFVSPKVAGVLMESKGRTVSSYKPPYVKFKYATEAEEVAANAEQIFYADNLTPLQRATNKAVVELEEGKNTIYRRIEKMAIDGITSGSVTVVGDGIEDVIDFKMPATNLKTLTGGALWSSSTANPIKDLRAWKREVVKASGVMPNKCVMGSDAIDAFLSNQQVINYLDKRHIKFGEIAPTNIGDGATYLGQIEGLDIYSYDAYYTDENDVTQDLFPVDKVLLGSTMAKTVLNFGAIKDFKAGTFVGETFVKSWEVEDPSARYVLFQSAPLPVPTQVSAFMCNKVV